MTERSPTAQESVLRALRSDIVLGVLTPGSQVVQEALAQRYGVSRVPLREALKILEGEGLVTYHPHRGYFVMELSLDDLIEVYRLRSILEAEAIACAVPRFGDADVEELEDLIRQVEAASENQDIAALATANRLLHFAIFDRARLPRLSRLLHQLWDATDVYRALYFQSPGNRERIALEHREMLDAIRQRDSARVTQLHEQHRRHSVESASSQLLGG